MAMRDAISRQCQRCAQGVDFLSGINGKLALLSHRRSGLHGLATIVELPNKTFDSLSTFRRKNDYIALAGAPGNTYLAVEGLKM